MVRMPPEVQGLASALLHFQPFLILALTLLPSYHCFGVGSGGNDAGSQISVGK